jgi:hypothetical protein
MTASAGSDEAMAAAASPAGARPAATARPVAPLERLEEILAWSRAANSRIGYFAALYVHVEHAIAAAIEAGEFRDPVALARVNEVFFDRYLAAVDQHRRGEPSTLAWLASFEAATDDNLVVVQHLLLGMNAHINFDLAIAVAEAIPPPDLEAFLSDFDHMNGLLMSLVDAVSADLSRVWPLLKWISRLTHQAEDAIIGFSMRFAREGAWEQARLLAGLEPSRRPTAILDRDRIVANLARIIVLPGRLVAAVLWLLRRTERGDVRAIIDDLLD